MPNVTVSFACSDALSGIGSCQRRSPSRRMARIKTSKELLKTRRETTATGDHRYQSRQDGAGDHKRCQSIAEWRRLEQCQCDGSFTCTDALSGVGSCQAPITVTTEGAIIRRRNCYRQRWKQRCHDPPRQSRQDGADDYRHPQPVAERRGLEQYGRHYRFHMFPIRFRASLPAQAGDANDRRRSPDSFGFGDRSRGQHIDDHSHGKNR
jgi:hypothetical protein